MATRVFGESVPASVLVVCGAVAATLLGDSMLYAVMPSRPDDWGLSIGLVGILLSANRLIRLLTNTLAGRLFVWFGPRPPFAAAIVLAMVTTATYGWATSFLVLLLARMVWGMCWSVLRLGAWWTVLDRATDANLGFLMGIYASVVRSGSLVGVLAGGLLTDAIGHEWTLTIFAVVTGLGGLAWLVTSRSTGAYRTAGAAPAAAGDSSASGAQGLRLMLADPKLLTVGIGGLAGMLVFSGLLTASLGFYFDARFGDEIGVFGLAIGVASFTGIALAIRFAFDLLLGPATGRLSDRLGRTPVIVTAFVFGAVGLLLLAASLPLAGVLPAMLLAFLSSTALIVLLHARAGDLAPAARRPPRRGAVDLRHVPRPGGGAGTAGGAVRGHPGGAALGLRRGGGAAGADRAGLPAGDAVGTAPAGAGIAGPGALVADGRLRIDQCGGPSAGCPSAGWASTGCPSAGWASAGCPSAG